jgi:hypothetical protein
MTLQEFKALTRQKQYRVIRYTGVYLGQRTLGSLKAELFQVSSFYLEAFYRLPAEELVFMKVFEGTAGLDPYLPVVDLQELLSYKGSN